MTENKKISVKRYIEKKEKRKYGNKECVFQGIMFASKGEMQRYIFLLGQLKQGKISGLKCQYEFEIKIAEQKICSYFADFVYYTPTGIMVVEDFKGMKTDVYRLKEKLMKAVHSITIRVVKSSTEEI